MQNSKMNKPLVLVENTSCLYCGQICCFVSYLLLIHQHMVCWFFGGDLNGSRWKDVTQRPSSCLGLNLVMAILHHGSLDQQRRQLILALCGHFCFKVRLEFFLSRLYLLANVNMCVILVCYRCGLGYMVITAWLMLALDTCVDFQCDISDMLTA